LSLTNLHYHARAAKATARTTDNETMRTRISSLALLVALTTAFGPISGAAARPQPVHLSSRVVTISSATIHRYLASVTNNGHTLRFRSSAGGLGRLRPGSVMLVPRSSALAVVSVRHAHGQLIVLTKTATLGQIMTSGTIQYQGSPDMRTAFPVRLNGVSDVAPAFVGRVRNRLGFRPADTSSFTVQGTTGHYGFSLKFTPTSSSRMDISGVLCYKWGSACSAGPSTGFSAEINFNGYIQTGQADVGVTVSNGVVDHTIFSLKNLVLHGHFTYDMTTGSTKDSPAPPLLRIPIGADWTIPYGGIPIYIKVQTALLLKFGIPSYGASLKGGMDVTSSGSDAVAQSGKQVSTSGSGEQVTVGPLTHQAGDVGPSNAGIGGAVVVGLETQIGAGVGVTMGNVIGYLNSVMVVTQRTQPAFGGLAGVDCSNYHVTYDLTAGIGGQIGPLSFTGPPKDIITPRSGDVRETGC
jgi:hypothetical protein